MRIKSLKIFTIIFVLFLCLAGNSKAAFAAPHLTLSPNSGSFSSGSEFTVVIGVDSNEEKSSAVDIYGSFDASKLKIVSIVKSPNAVFPFDMVPEVQNETGKFNFACSSTDSSSLEDKVIKGDLAIITFQAKASGVASLNFVCQNGSTTDTNIFNSTGNDVVACSSNQSGSYNIVVGTGGVNDTVTPTRAATTNPTSTTSPELPKTGGLESTVGLIIFGAISVGGAFLLRFL